MEQGRDDLIPEFPAGRPARGFRGSQRHHQFKSDKREALRKLEQTEANLLRLADIIKEVRRQIISLHGAGRRGGALQRAPGGIAPAG